MSMRCRICVWIWLPSAPKPSVTTRRLAGPVAMWKGRPMSAIALELEQTLASIPPAQATLLERLVSDALNLVKAKSSLPAVDANGWPLGHFDKYAGSFANEPLDEPVDLPPEPSTEFLAP